MLVIDDIVDFYDGLLLEVVEAGKDAGDCLL